MIQVNRIYLIFNRLVTKNFLVDTSVFDCEMKSIYKNRQRLKADLGLTKNDSLEQMIMMY